MVLSEDVWSKFFRDLNVACECIGKLVSGEATNAPISDPDFIAPGMILGTFARFSDSKGLYAHYAGVREVLEIALVDGSIPRAYSDKPYMSRAPYYVQDLISKE